MLGLYELVGVPDSAPKESGLKHPNMTQDDHRYAVRKYFRSFSRAEYSLLLATVAEGRNELVSTNLPATKAPQEPR